MQIYKGYSSSSLPFSLLFELVKTSSFSKREGKFNGKEHVCVIFSYVYNYIYIDKYKIIVIFFINESVYLLPNFPCFYLFIFFTIYVTLIFFPPSAWDVIEGRLRSGTHRGL